MAQSISLHSGSPLMGSPVIFRVVANDLSLISHLAAHKVYLSVEIDMVSSDRAKETYEFSVPIAQEGESVSVDMDISSALRAYADDYEYTPLVSVGTSITYPIFRAKLQAWDTYMRDGISQQSGLVVLQQYYYFLLGQFTDSERQRSGLLRGVNTLTRKPASGELVAPYTSLYVSPLYYAYSSESFFNGIQPAAPETEAFGTEELDANALNTIEGRSVWVSDSDEDPFVQFQFVNGYGVLESAFAMCLPEVSVEKEVQEYSVTVPMAFNKVDRAVTLKRASRHVFKMSSGPVTEEWQAWWQEEFLNTKQAWMYYKQGWIPVSIVPDDTTKGIDYTKNDLASVEFEVKLNIEGV